MASGSILERSSSKALASAEQAAFAMVFTAWKTAVAVMETCSKAYKWSAHRFSDC